MSVRESRAAALASPAFIALSCAGLIASAPGYAQSATPAATPNETKSLGGVTVTDTVIDESVKVEKAESPKYVRTLLDTPQTITVIANQTIRQQNLLTLRDVLSTVPGITFGAGEGGGGYGDSINLRGQSANNDIQIDGVRDSAQYSRTDPYNIEQIEVVNGANGVYGGSGSIGGTINLVTKRPKAEDLTVLQAGIGTDNYYRATVDSNVRVSDFIAVRLNAMGHKNDIPGRDFDRNKRWGVSPAVTFGIDSPTSLTILYTHQHDDNIPQYGVPYYKNAIYDGPLPGVPDSGYYGYKNVDFQKQDIDQATGIFAHQFNDNLSFRNLLRYQRVKQDLVVDPPQGSFCLANNLSPTGTACAAGVAAGTFLPSGPRGGYRFSVNNTMYDQADWTARFAGGHTLVVGASYLKEDYDLTSGNVLRNPGGATPNPALNAINLANPNAIYTGPINYTKTGFQTGELTNLAAYAFGAIKVIEQLEINGGVRYEKNKAGFRTDTITPPLVAIPTGQVGRYVTGGDQHDHSSLFSYRVGLVYKPATNASLYVAYGNSKTPTATSVRAGCGLATTANFGVDPCNGAKPEQTVNYEIGGKIDLFDAKLQLTASLFRNERTNYRVTSNDPFIGTLPVNDGKNRVDGLTLGASGKITSAWSIFANYTYLDSKVLQSVSDSCLANPRLVTTVAAGVTTITNPCGNSTAVRDPQKGQELTNTPKHSGSLFTTYTFGFGLQVGYGLTYQGSFLLTNRALLTPLVAGASAIAPTYRSDDYLTHRAFVSYPVTDKLTAQVNVQNFTNEKYYTSIRNNGWATPGEDRSAVLSLYYSF
jgi:catecholate siderophore receptor